MAECEHIYSLWFKRIVKATFPRTTPYITGSLDVAIGCPHLGWEMFAPFHFECDCNAKMCGEFLCLTTGQPMSNCCSHGTPPNTAFNCRIWIFATTTKIGTVRNFACASATCLADNIRTPPTHHINAFEIVNWHRPHGVAPSISGASLFGRWVVTHSLAGFDFHGHRPAVKMDKHPLWYLTSMQLSTLFNR